MYFSQLSLNMMECKGLNLKNSYDLHKLVYNLFPNNTKRDFLFVDKGVKDNKRIIWVQSETKPFELGYGKLAIKEFPETFFKHKTFTFKTIVNVVKYNEDKKRIAVKDRNEIVSWFSDVCKKNNIVSKNVFVKNVTADIFEKGDNQKVTLNVVEIVGSVACNDEESLKKFVSTGVGRGKSFGYGLITLFPIKEGE